MQVAVLASGSKGNCTFVELEGVRVLVDAGISARRIKQELAGIGRDIDDIDAVFITHEHGDHVKGLPTLTKRHRLQVYSRPDTFRAMGCYRDIEPECIHAIGEKLRLGRVLIKAFPIPHDAADPVGYSIIGSTKCTVATDIGFMSDSIQSALEGSQVAVLEANHDVEMLKNGSYSWSLKQRILSNRGHLSNEEAGRTLASLKNRPRHVFLAHLSEENNTSELAFKTVQDVLRQQGIVNMKLIMTAQSKCAALEL